MSNDSKLDLEKYMPSREDMLAICDEDAAQRRLEETRARLRDMQEDPALPWEGDNLSAGSATDQAPPAEPAAPVEAMPETPWAREPAVAAIDKTTLPSTSAPMEDPREPSRTRVVAGARQPWKPYVIGLVATSAVFVPVVLVALALRPAPDVRGEPAGDRVPIPRASARAPEAVPTASAAVAPTASASASPGERDDAGAAASARPKAGPARLGATDDPHIDAGAKPPESATPAATPAPPPTPAPKPTAFDPFVDRRQE